MDKLKTIIFKILMECVNGISDRKMKRLILKNQKAGNSDLRFSIVKIFYFSAFSRCLKLEFNFLTEYYNEYYY